MGQIGVADLHVHTSASDGSDAPEAVVRWADRVEIDVLAITDHDVIDGAISAREVAITEDLRTEVIVGEEVSTLDGHVLGLFLEEPVPPGMCAARTVEAIHRQGGLAVAAHPFWRAGELDRRAYSYSVGSRLLDVEFDAVEVVNGSFNPAIAAANRRAAEVNADLLLPAIAASDAHVKELIGCSYTAFPGRTAADLGAALRGGLTVPGRSRYRLSGLSRGVTWLATYALRARLRAIPAPAEPA